MSVRVGSLEVPTDEGRLQALLDSGALTTRTEVDVKSALPATGAATKGLACDLASFAVEGGLYIIGVEERPTIRLAPQPLAGLRERVSSIAKDSVRPSLRVDIRAIPASAGTADGYLVVIVPTSPDAPHQADYRYWGRSAAGRVPLRHEEVERIRAARAPIGQDDIRDLLSEAVRDDPVPPAERKAGHLFVVARPVAGVARMLRDTLGRSFEPWVKTDMVNAASSPSWWSPDLRSCWKTEPRLRGYALFGSGFGAGRTVEPDADEAMLLEVTVSDAGEVRLFCGRGSDVIRGDAQWFIIEWIVAGLAIRVVEIVRAVAQRTDFRGDWDFGLALTGVRGARGAQVVEKPFTAAGATPFPEDDYQATTRGTATEIGSDPLVIAERLTDDLFTVLDRGRFRLRA